MTREDALERLEQFAREWPQRRAEHDAAGQELIDERARVVREAYDAGVTQPEIAEILAVSQQLVSRILRS